MNELQSRLSRILELGLTEYAQLAEQSWESPSRALDDLAETLERLPALVYNWRRLSMDALEKVLHGHQRDHADCPHDYHALLADVRVPAWHVWNRQRVRGTATAGDDRLSEAQVYLLAIEVGLFRATHPAVSTVDRERIRQLGTVALQMPDLLSAVDLDRIFALAGPTGPYARTGSPHWPVFQPLTLPLDDVVRKYLR